MSQVPFKPVGYNSLSPYFIVDDAQTFMDFLTKVFDAKPLRKYEGEDGRIMHAEMQLDDSVLMLTSSTEQFPANTLMLHMYVPDVHKTYELALANGAEAMQAPVNQGGDPDTRGAFYDVAGNWWSVATQLTSE